MPASKNFIVSPAVTIRQIRENLREGRYSQAEGIFGILKELVQNAEDAEARRLMIAWTPRVPGSTHPLLQGPAILAVNDGNFKSKDGRAIRRFSLNSKAADAASIGKFGLGLKSVFHLAEVFFFAAVDDLGGPVDADVLNPWSDELSGLHPKWDIWSDEDQNRFRDFARWFGLEGRQFSLCIPLRRKDTLAGVEPITRNFPGEAGPEILLDDALPRRLARLLPLLSHVREISVWTASQGGPQRRYAVSVKDASTRRVDMKTFDGLQANSPRSFGGRCSIAGTMLDGDADFGGMEQRRVDTYLTTLEQGEVWPQDIAMDEESGEETHVREKAHPHAAVCFAATRTAPHDSTLAVYWSMFLPLTEPEVISLTPVGWCVDLFLHGYFFVDAGRNQIEGILAEAPPTIESSGALRRAWNQHLASQGTLPLLPIALADIVQRTGWGDEEVLAVTRGLASSSLLQRFTSDVCRDYCWINRLLSDGRSAWQTVKSSNPVLTIPGGSVDRQLALEVFPGLRQLAEQSAITFQNEPAFAPRTSDVWPDNQVRQLLRSVATDRAFSAPERIDYLARFVRHATASCDSDAVAQEMVSVLRTGLAAFETPARPQIIAALRGLIRLVPGSRRIKLRLRGTGRCQELFGLLCRQDLGAAWIPHELEPAESPSTGKLTPGDSARLLSTLSEWGRRELSASDRDAVAEVAAQVFRSTTDSVKLAAVVGDLPLFNGTNCREKKETLLSRNELVAHNNKKTLFAKPSPMAYQLQDALAEESLLLIARDLYVLLFDVEKAPTCSERQLLEALATDARPRLAGPAQRRRLLGTLLGYREGRSEPYFVQCVRYVLHGRREQFNATEDLLVPGVAGDIWWRMARIALEQSHAEWRVLDASFADSLSGEDRDELDIRPVDAGVALKLAAKVDPAKFVALEPTDEQYSTLLRHIDDVTFCRRLPIHRDVSGRYVAIDEHTFWQSSEALPDGLASKVRLLNRSSDQTTWSRQTLLARPLDAVAILETVLEQPRPGEYYGLILDCLLACSSRRTHVPSDLYSRLRSSTWLPTSSGQYVRPHDVIHIPELADEIAQLVADHPGAVTDVGALAEPVRKHSGYAFLEERIFPRREDALASLGTLLIENEANAVGSLAVQDLALGDWLEAFREVPKELHPGHRLLRRVADLFPDYAERTFEKLRRPIPGPRVIELLKFLKDEHEAERTATRRQRILRVSGRYLRMLLTRESFTERLSNVLLPAKDGFWQIAAKLCRANDGVADRHVVHPVIEEALKDVFPDSVTDKVMRLRDAVPHGVQKDDATVIKEVVASADRLRAYFDPWRDVIPNEQIGGFLALLGDTPGVPELAQRFLGKNRSVESTRDKFSIDETCLHRQRILAEVLQAPTVTVVNLFGTTINVSRNERPATLFVGYGDGENPFPDKIFSFSLCCFRLNKVDPHQFSGGDLSRLLRESAVKFVTEAYRRPELAARVATTLDELAQSDQLDIAVTQSRIVEHGFLILDQYGLRIDPTLGAVLEKWDAAERLKAERDTSSTRTRLTSGRNPDTELRTAREELKRLLETSSDTQLQVLQAVRCRVASYYQYTPDAIPFELFQNADDAYAQLDDVLVSTSKSAAPELPSFLVLEQDNAVIFIHFGRRINQHPLDDERARDQGGITGRICASCLMGAKKFPRES